MPRRGLLLRQGGQTGWTDRAGAGRVLEGWGVRGQLVGLTWGSLSLNFKEEGCGWEWRWSCQEEAKSTVGGAPQDGNLGRQALGWGGWGLDNGFTLRGPHPCPPLPTGSLRT